MKMEYEDMIHQKGKSIAKSEGHKVPSIWEYLSFTPKAFIKLRRSSILKG